MEVGTAPVFVPASWALCSPPTAAEVQCISRRLRFPALQDRNANPHKEHVGLPQTSFNTAVCAMTSSPGNFNSDDPMEDCGVVSKLVTGRTLEDVFFEQGATEAPRITLGADNLVQGCNDNCMQGCNDKFVQGCNNQFMQGCNGHLLQGCEDSVSIEAIPLSGEQVGAGSSLQGLTKGAAPGPAMNHSASFTGFGMAAAAGSAATTAAAWPSTPGRILHHSASFAGFGVAAPPATPPGEFSLLHSLDTSPTLSTPPPAKRVVGPSLSLPRTAFSREVLEDGWEPSRTFPSSCPTTPTTAAAAEEVECDGGTPQAFQSVPNVLRVSRSAEHTRVAFSRHTLHASFSFDNAGDSSFAPIAEEFDEGFSKCHMSPSNSLEVGEPRHCRFADGAPCGTNVHNVETTSQEGFSPQGTKASANDSHKTGEEERRDEGRMSTFQALSYHGLAKFRGGSPTARFRSGVVSVDQRQPCENTRAKDGPGSDAIDLGQLCPKMAQNEAGQQRQGLTSADPGQGRPPSAVDQGDFEAPQNQLCPGLDRNKALQHGEGLTSVDPGQGRSPSAVDHRQLQQTEATEEGGEGSPWHRLRNDRDKSQDPCSPMSRGGKVEDGGGRGGSPLQRYTQEQKERLERSFQMNQVLGRERREGLAKALNIHPRQVAFWYENRRVRWRRGQGAQLPAGTSASWQPGSMPGVSRLKIGACSSPRQAKELWQFLKRGGGVGEDRSGRMRSEVEAQRKLWPRDDGTNVERAQTQVPQFTDGNAPSTAGR